PGERATLDGQLLVETQGSDVTFWGLELMQSNPLDGDLPTLRALASGGRYINLVIHDAGENGVSLRSTSGYSELYGSIIYDNGNDEHLDQGVYAPNDAGEKRITDNVFFNNLASGIQVYGTTNHPVLTDVWVEGNISFNNSSIASTVGEENLTIGGATITDRVFVLGNLLYYAGEGGQNLRFGLEGKDNRNATVRDNYVVGGSTVVRSEDFASAIVENNTFVGTARMARLGGASLAGHQWAGNVYYRDPAARAWNWNGKLYDFEGFRAATGLGATDRAIAELPTEPMILVRPNRYEAGRAHIAVVNWGRAASVAVDVSAVLLQGDRWELRNVQDVFGPPVASGTYGGGPIHVPLTGVEPPPAAGRPGRPGRTAPDFDAFLLTITPRGR
ncbi:MAG: right-handed parallel beta-helix repeat-containing protein, partial [Gemmatimonadaceae bacterium]